MGGTLCALAPSSDGMTATLEAPAGVLNDNADVGPTPQHEQVTTPRGLEQPTLSSAGDATHSRRRRLDRVRARHPDRIPVICKSSATADVEHKLLVPKCMPGSQLQEVLS